VHLVAGTRAVIDGVGDITGGIFAPASHCLGTPDTCGPGVSVPLDAHWSGSDFTGTATLDGRTFDIGAGSFVDGSALVNFTGSFAAPSFIGQQLVSVSAPFQFTGQLKEPDRIGEPSLIVFLTGRGTAQVDLAWNTTAGGAWEFRGALYQFEAVEPVPEPATMVLFGSGMFGYAALHRRRRRSASSDSAAG
jgi:hypothetical protein